MIAQFEDALNQDQRAGASTVSSGFKLDNVRATLHVIGYEGLRQRTRFGTPVERQH